MSVIFGLVVGFGESANRVDESHRSNRPRIRRSAIYNLLGESLDPREKNILLVWREVLGNLSNVREYGRSVVFTSASAGFTFFHHFSMATGTSFLASLARVRTNAPATDMVRWFIAFDAAATADGVKS